MCGVFGFILKNNGYIPGIQRRRVVRGLGIAAEVRGTDATGVAFPDPDKNKLKIAKAPIRASNFPFYQNLPLDATVVIGHTRATTQGSASRNENNHPFKGVTKNGQEFVLAHNGMIWNDQELKAANDLSYDIETDSYVAVALLQKHNEINMDSVKAVSEKLEGSFVLTILAGDRVVFVKHDNPLTIYDFKELGFLLYASTEAILQRGLRKEYQLWKYYKKNKDKVDVIQPKEDSIMIYDRIKDTWEIGKFEAADFTYSYNRGFWWRLYNSKKPVVGTYKKDKEPKLVLPEKLAKPLTEVTWDDFYVDTIGMSVYTPSGIYTFDEDWLYEDVIINKYGEFELRGLWFPHEEDLTIYKMAQYLYGKYWADKYYTDYILGDENIREGV